MAVPMNPLPQYLRDAFQRKTVFDEKGREIPIAGNVTLEEALALYRAVHTLAPSASVETGFAQGVSTIAILQAHADRGNGAHHVIDPFQAHYGDAGLESAARASLTAPLRFHRRFPDEVIPTLPRLQFAFIDSSHLFDHTIAEFVMIDRKLDVGGIIALHDLWMPALQRVIRYVLSNRAYDRVRTFDSATPTLTRPAPSEAISPLAHILRTFGRTRRLLRQDILKPWKEYKMPNLVFLRKTDEDRRDWRFHRDF